ncbi:MAG: arginine--tRNA ligase [Gammaproteobacteria bacterium]|nr:arginine--tRNA ligase [Gammaproteobacteria bacterium]
MKHLLRNAIDAALARLREAGTLADAPAVDYQVEVPKLEAHGDFSTNVAMLLAKPCRRPPRELASALAECLRGDALFAAIEVAGPGFINFVVDPATVFGVVDAVLAEGPDYGRSDLGAGRRVQVEYVSANPTGPLHIGHGRGAAIGSVIARLLAVTGHDVCREYYVNDAGRQMDILALSVCLRYLELGGVEVDFPAQAYRGDYVVDIARAWQARHGDAWAAGVVAPSSTIDDDAERALDAAIAHLRTALGEARFATLRDFAKDTILEEIKADLVDFGVEFDVWYSEAGLMAGGLVDDAMAVLERNGHIYVEAGARWFRSAALGDEKNRVVVRENGLKTYFASDIAYHLDKFQRGFAEIIDVWGADHHGYVPRVRAAITALGEDAARLSVVLVQFAALVRGGEKVAMSTRAGEFVTLKQLVDEVGVDAARFFYVMRRADQHLEFDLDLATAESSDNPVYYVQYAHARICSVERQLAERGLTAPGAPVELATVLDAPAERRLAKLLWHYPEMIETAASAREPHLVTQYLRDLATEFHGYYNGHKILVDDGPLRDARVRLCDAVRRVLANGLEVIGISAPTEM